ncbi:MAG: ABC transporter permease [Acidimicrobiia bacterium]|nr:ABC transporter permease [Acidimicrobiia bacterium]
MFRLALQGVRHNVGRYLATLVAIITGVAFFASAGFVADRIIGALEGDVDDQYANVDVAVVPESADVFDTADAIRIPASVADAIAAAPGVEEVAGELTGHVGFADDQGRPADTDAIGRLWIEESELNPAVVVEGEAPRADGEIAVDRGLAEAEGFAVGSQVTVLTPSGPFPATVTGITAFGATDAQDPGGTVAVPAASAFEWLNRNAAAYDVVLVRGSVDPDTLVATIAPLTPSGVVTQTGDEFRDERRQDVGAIGRVLKQVLQFFALLALAVGGFVIYNTFSVIVAQRTRELAVLAAIGATPKQLKRSLRFEGMTIGVIGSVLGVVAGYLLALLLVVVLAHLDMALPGAGLVVGVGTVVWSMIFGVLITTLSVLVPARRASKAEPIAALRDADESAVGTSGARSVVAAVLIGLGVVGAVVGGSALVLGAAIVVLFLGVVLAGPLVAVVGSRMLRPVLSRVGMEGRLAAENTARNARRTATTSNALLVGVFLVTFVTVAGTGVKDYAVEQVAQLSSADLVLDSTGGSLDEALLSQLEAVDGVEAVAAVRRAPVQLSVDAGDLQSSSLATGDVADIVDVAGITFESGSADDLGPGTVAIGRLEAFEADIGSTATVVTLDGEEVTLEVVAIMAISLDGLVVGALTDPVTFDGLAPEAEPSLALIRTAAGAVSSVSAEIEDLLSGRPDITVSEGNFLGELVGAVFNFVIGAVNGLLMMSVIVALIGIVNTLTLSILERRRELGLLRIVGMTDRRVRRMVRLESVVIATLGTTSGMVLGVFTGVAVVLSVGRMIGGIDVSVPYALLGVILVIGIGLGLLASVVPAYRSTRMEPLEAVQAT